MSVREFWILACVLIVVAGASEASADDVGVTKARLIQKAERSYVLEADVTQMQVWAIKTPVFPDRFHVSRLEYVRQAGWIVAKATATTKGEPLSARDDILLPWMRNGAAVTVQWLDGSVHQGLFLRSAEGIRIPLRMLMPATQSLRELCTEHFTIGLKHLTFKWVHFLFVWALALLAPAGAILGALTYYAFGQASSLVLAEAGVPGFDLIFVDILGGLLMLMMAYGAVRGRSHRPYLPLLLLFGLLHGLAYAQECSHLDLGMGRKIPPLFMFNIAVDLGHFAFGILLMAAAKALGRLPHSRTIACYTVGVWSVALLAALFQEHVIQGKTDVVGLRGSRMAAQYALPPSQEALSGIRKPAPARGLTGPVMIYLAVEPYEVRQEVLIRAGEAVRLLGPEDRGVEGIPVESLDRVKQGILALVRKANSISIDGKPAEPDLARADFVTLGPSGVTVRPGPVPESLDHGVIGLTLVYETTGMADEVRIDWRLFSGEVRTIEATATDPFGVATMLLSAENNALHWRRRLSGYRVPVIEEITVQRPRLPVVSAILFLVALALPLLSVRKRTFLTGRPVRLIAALGFLTYPFLRIPLDLPWVDPWKPSIERTSVILDGLLTNVYRAFDVRDEVRVYDRLATSVTGDQLAQVYLENRQSLELENRGGARAKVDEVEVLAVQEVTPSEGGGFIADAVWTVSGSVDHFGHTHYRRNRSHGLVSFIRDGDAWKIREIELIEEKRLL